jgi:hypothetical protein
MCEGLAEDLSSCNDYPFPDLSRLEPDVPWLSFDTLGLRSKGPASPAWSPQEPSDLSGLDQGDPPWLCAIFPLSAQLVLFYAQLLSFTFPPIMRDLTILYTFMYVHMYIALFHTVYHILCIYCLCCILFYLFLFHSAETPSCSNIHWLLIIVNYCALFLCRTSPGNVMNAHGRNPIISCCG